MSSKLELSQVFLNTANLKVLSVLLKNPDNEFYDSEVHKLIPDLSMASVNNTLKNLHSCGLTERTARGGLFFNQAKEDIPELKFFKLISNLIEARKIIEPALKHILKATLYGSYATGDNDSKSDIDIFIVSENENIVRKRIKKNDKVQLVIKKITEIPTFKDENKVFWNQVEKGIVLWKDNHNYGL